jgi:anion-transporting  ArsA/GET3 family ATPase
VALITGKGGVGRTVTTAALAHLAQRRGIPVLVAEITEDGLDYSPVAHLFGREQLPRKPEELAPGIRGAALLARTGQEMFLASVLSNATIARAALGNDSLRRLLSAGPSFREMGVYFQLLHYLRATRSDGRHEYPLILLDMPATGHTLSLTGLPALLLKLVPRGPIAEALREGQGYMNNPATAGAYAVTLPETLPVSECLELLEGLAATSVPLGGLFLNRMPQDPFTPAEREALEPILAQRALLGAEGFRRVASARREALRLRSSTPLPILPLPELPGAGAGLVESLLPSFEREALLVAKPMERVA